MLNTISHRLPPSRGVVNFIWAQLYTVVNIRRTFTTRALYEGQSLEALRSQLGHTTIMSTLLYSKLDLFEHPGQVRAPLDLYGRHALTLWKTPLLLDELPPEERVRLLKQQ